MKEQETIAQIAGQIFSSLIKRDDWLRFDGAEKTNELMDKAVSMAKSIYYKSMLP